MRTFIETDLELTCREKDDLVNLYILACRGVTIKKHFLRSVGTGFKPLYCEVLSIHHRDHRAPHRPCISSKNCLNLFHQIWSNSVHNVLNVMYVCM